MNHAQRLGIEAAQLLFKSAAGPASLIKALAGAAKGLPTARVLPQAASIGLPAPATASRALSVLRPSAPSISNSANLGPIITPRVIPRQVANAAEAATARRRLALGLDTMQSNASPARNLKLAPGVQGPAPPAPPPVRGGRPTPQPVQPAAQPAATTSFVSQPATQSMLGSGASTQTIPPVTGAPRWKGQPARPAPQPGGAQPPGGPPPGGPPGSPPPPTGGPPPIGDPGLGPNGLPNINTNGWRPGGGPSAGPATPPGAPPGGRGLFEALGSGADALTSGAGSLGSSAGRAWANSLGKNPITTLGWTGALGVPAAGAAMEGASAIGQLTGLSPSNGDSYFAPHLSSLRFDPSVVGEGRSLWNRFTSPIQYASHLMGGPDQGPQGLEMLSGYNPMTGGMDASGLGSQNFKIDPATGQVALQGSFQPGLNPLIQRQLDSRRQMLEKLAPQFGFGRLPKSTPAAAKPRETYNGPLLQVGDT